MRTAEAVGYRVAVYRLFTDFPSGPPGLGLLLLRVALAGLLLIDGAARIAAALAADRLGTDAVGGASAIGLGLLVAAGFLTPIVQVIVALVESAGLAGNFFSLHASMAVGAKLEWRPALLASTIALALAMLGPGRYSVDCRVFGRREIVVSSKSSIRSR